MAVFQYFKERKETNAHINTISPINLAILRHTTTSIRQGREVHYGLVLLAGVMILGGQIHENKLNQTLTANKYRTTVTYQDGHQIELGYKNTEDFLADAELEAKTNNDKVKTHNVEDMKSEIITTEKGLTFKLYYDDVKIWNGEKWTKQ